MRFSHYFYWAVEIVTMAATPSSRCACWLADVEWELNSSQWGMRSLLVSGKLQTRTRSCVTSQPTNRYVFARWLVRMARLWRGIIKTISARVSWGCNGAASFFSATRRKLRVYFSFHFKISTQPLSLYIHHSLSYVNCELFGPRKFAWQVTLPCFFFYIKVVMVSAYHATVSYIRKPDIITKRGLMDCLIVCTHLIIISWVILTHLCSCFFKFGVAS